MSWIATVGVVRGEAFGVRDDGIIGSGGVAWRAASATKCWLGGLVPCRFFGVKIYEEPVMRLAELNTRKLLRHGFR